MSDAGDLKPTTAAGKAPLDLLPWEALGPVAEAFACGARKYRRDNWRSLTSRRVYLGAALRHLAAWAMREDTDPDSGLPHLAHAAASVLILLTAEIHGLGEDDRA